MRRVFKWLVRGIAVLLVLATGLLGGLWLWLSRSVPDLAGTHAVAGITAPATIVRDAEGIPHITGATEGDVWFALGFAHAQDRMWQMEVARRLPQGRMAEIFGARAAGFDRHMRAIGLHDSATRTLGALSPRSRAALAAYAAGVNGWLTGTRPFLSPRLPPEFTLLRHQPEPWTPVDSIAVVKLMQLMLSMNMRHEIARMQLAARFTPGEIEDLMPTGAKRPLPDLRTLYPGLGQPLAAAPQEPGSRDIAWLLEPGVWASNSWVVSGNRTVSGLPLLANDPHLGLSAPPIWYLAHLRLPDPDGAIDIVGASLPGTPMITLGQTNDIAWGFTNAGADVQDLFVEKLAPGDPDSYMTPDGPRPFTGIGSETIQVRGGPPQIVQRRATRHGPVVPASSPLLGGLALPGHVFALSWTALDDADRTIEAAFAIPRARSWEAFRDALRTYGAPVQAIVYADRTGHIAMIAPGRIPTRNPANAVEGRAPVPGWDATYDWTGFIDFDDLPQTLDPDSGAIATANAAIVGPDFPFLITHDWDAPTRADRIRTLINQRRIHTVDSFTAMQRDVHSTAAEVLLPAMIGLARDHAGYEARRLLPMLADWDHAMRATGPEALVWMAWLDAALAAVFADEMGPDAFGSTWRPDTDSLARVLAGVASRDWCDDVRTPARHESCGATLAVALEAARLRLTADWGEEPAQWNWGTAHEAVHSHRPFSLVPVLQDIFTIRVPTAGGDDTIMRGAMRGGTFTNVHASGYRAVYDLAERTNSAFIQSTGQSGNPFSTLWDSMVLRWAGGETFPIAVAPENYTVGQQGTITLVPR